MSGEFAVAVVGPPAAAQSAAAAVALALPRDPGGATALVLTFGADPPALAASGLALPAARRLAAHLASWDVPGAAAGRLVWAALSQDAPAAQARRAAAAAPGSCVLALCGARSDVGESLLALAAVVYIVGAEEDPACRLALDALRRDGARAAALELPPGLAATAARLGIGVSAGVRRALRGLT
ncbi:unannotated protein [freshwater metagenome]|uniref:Unannotated protein n=1 Tax=freshwater metagenome TaxID=449393 RepID=A0A6J7HEZ4_9ZZZZ